MRKFIEITQQGERILINTNCIESVKKLGDEGIAIFLDSGFCYMPDEDDNEVVWKIEEATKCKSNI